MNHTLKEANHKNVCIFLYFDKVRESIYLPTCIPGNKELLHRPAIIQLPNNQQKNFALTHILEFDCSDFVSFAKWSSVRNPLSDWNNGHVASRRQQTNTVERFTSQHQGSSILTVTIPLDNLDEIRSIWGRSWENANDLQATHKARSYKNLLPIWYFLMKAGDLSSMERGFYPELYPY